MKKYTFLVTAQEYDQFISDIRDLGLIHVEEMQSGATSDELTQALNLSERYRQALSALSFAAESYTASATFAPQPANPADAISIIAEVEALVAKENDLKHQVDDLNRSIAALEPWGEINWQTVGKLVEAGLTPYFYCVGSKQYKAEWAERWYATPIDEIAKKIYFVAFSSEGEPDITAERLQLPEKPLSVYLQTLKTVEAQLISVHDELLRINGESMPTILAGQTAVQNDINLSRVHLYNEEIAEGAVKLMVGWSLTEDEQSITAYLDKAGIYYEVQDPAFEDNVPIKIVNNKFTTLFEPILRMYSLPNYHDIDPLPLFAPFFMLFFGLCMGDLGYGLIITAISLIVCTKPALKSFGQLGALLGGMTCICGFITGTFFGIDLSTVDWAFIKPMQPYFVNDSMKEHFFGYSPMMVISVIIGLIQVLIGMTMAGCKAVKNYGFIYGVGKFSWVTALLSAVILFGLPMFGAVIPAALQYVLYALIAVSAFGIYFFNNPAAYQKAGTLWKLVGAGMNLGGGLWATYGMSTGLLGDLLSYIRLFALGLTGGVLGSVFNSLAMEMSPQVPVVHEIVMLFILLFGHGINFGLCMISSFVHPMRLTFVEYFKNAEFEGNGKEYQPFKVM